MNKKISKILKRVGEDDKENRAIIKKSFPDALSSTQMEKTLTDIVNSDISNQKKLEFLIAFFGSHASGTFYMISDSRVKSHNLIADMVYRTEFKLYPKVLQLAQILSVCRFDFYYKLNSGHCLMEIIDYMGEKYSELEVTPKEIYEAEKQYQKLKKTIYELDFSTFMNDYIDLDNEELKEKVVKYFGDLSSLSLLQKSLKATDDYELNFKMYKKLLEIGLNPNNLDNLRSSIVDYTLDNDIEYFYNVIEEAYKYGFDINVDKYFPIFVLESDCNYAHEIIDYVIDNGLYDYDIVFDDIAINVINDYKKYNDLINYCSNIESFVLMIGTLVSANYDIEKFKDICKIRSEINKILNKVRGLFSNMDNQEFSKLWVQQVISNRNNSINSITGEVSINEILTALRDMVNDAVYNFNSELETQKEKTLKI